MPELYEKVMKGRRTTYVPYSPVTDATVVEFDLNEAQCLTAAGALGVTLLNIFERHIPAHKRNARKIKAVQDAVLSLYAGSGQAIDVRLADVICKSWDQTFKQFADGVVVPDEAWHGKQ